MNRMGVRATGFIVRQSSCNPATAPPNNRLERYARTLLAERAVRAIVQSMAHWPFLVFSKHENRATPVLKDAGMAIFDVLYGCEAHSGS